MAISPYPQMGWSTVGGPGGGSMTDWMWGGQDPNQDSAHGSLMYDKNGNPFYAGNPGDAGYKGPGTGTGTGMSPFPGGVGAPGTDPSSVAKNFLNSVMSGKQLPFDKVTQRNMLTQASDMNASAEHARNATMNSNAAINGQSMSDPSLAGARMNSMATRQTGNATAAGTIATQANRANFNAKLGAAGTLADIGAQENDMAARQRALTLAGAYDQVSRPQNSGNALPFGPYPGIDFGTTQESVQQPAQQQQPGQQQAAQPANNAAQLRQMQLKSKVSPFADPYGTSRLSSY